MIRTMAASICNTIIAIIEIDDFYQQDYELDSLLVERGAKWGAKGKLKSGREGE